MMIKLVQPFSLLSPSFFQNDNWSSLDGWNNQQDTLRLIHTRCSSLRFPQWTVSTQRWEIFYLPAEMQPSATDTQKTQ